MSGSFGTKVLGVGIVALVIATGGASGSDLDRLQGRWICGTGTDDKVLVTWEFTRQALVITEDASALGANYGKQVLKGSSSVRETANPKEMDITLKLSGPEENVPPLRAIYVLDGDRLKICYGRPGSPRPTHFPEGVKEVVRPDDKSLKLLDLRRIKDEPRK